MDVLAGGKIHHGVCAPFGRPTHLLDFFLDARSDGAVPDVGIDLHKKVAADNHRFALGVINVDRNDGAARGYFGADELGRDLFRNALREATKDRGRILTIRKLARTRMLLVENVTDIIICQLGHLRAAHILTDRDELHLGRDNSLLRIPQLRYGLAFARTDRATALTKQTRKFHQSILLSLACKLRMLAREITIIHRFYFPPIVFLNIATSLNPLRTQCGKAFVRFSCKCWITPRPRAVIHAHRLVRRHSTSVRFCLADSDFAHRHLHIGVDLALQIDTLAIWQLLAAMWFVGLFG